MMKPHISHVKREQIDVESLKNVSVLFENDVSELARFLLKMNDAKAANIHSAARHTVHGLATEYSKLSWIEHETIIEVLRKHRLPLGATVEHTASI